MLFITVGTQKFPMDRLLKAIDKYVAENVIQDKVFMQTGHSAYIPQNCEWQSFLTAKEMSEKVASADLIITHGGTGSIINAIKANKPTIAVIRLPQYNEHVDEHQRQIVEEFTKDGLILGTDNVEDIPELINKAKTYRFANYKSGNSEMLNDIRQTLATWERQT